MESEARSIIPNMGKTFRSISLIERWTSAYIPLEENWRAKVDTMDGNEAAIAAVLMTYQDALNASDTEAVMKLYAVDGVFMPQDFLRALARRRYARRMKECSARSR
jgi:hypothetical protein